MAGDWAGYHRVRVGNVRVDSFGSTKIRTSIFVDHIGPRGNLSKGGQPDESTDTGTVLDDFHGANSAPHPLAHRNGLQALCAITIYIKGHGHWICRDSAKTPWRSTGDWVLLHRERPINLPRAEP